MDKRNSLYRVYRPSNFNEVAGHDNVKEILISQLKNNNFPNAMLFTGQRGTGKTSLSKIFAKSVSCSELIDGYNPCDKCDNCISINKNSHPDFFEIDAASNNGVDEIRNIKASVSTLPILSKYKVYVIDEVHMLTINAFNALLKTLEEPPKHVLFILATTEFSKIPATIISRCQTFNFKRISKSALENKVKEISNKEGFEINQSALEEIYYMSDGSLRDSLNYLEQCMVFENKNITEDELKKIFYISTKPEKISIIKNVLNNNHNELIEYFEKANDKGLDFETLSLSLINIIKELIEYKMTNNNEFLNVISIEDLNDFENISVESLFELSDNLSEAYGKTRNSNINFQYILISLLKPLISVSTNKFIGSESKPCVEPLKETVSIPEEKDELLIEPIIINETPTDENVVELKNDIVEERELVYMFDFEKLKIELLIEENSLSTNEINFDNDTILNILVGADKEFRTYVQKKFEDLFEHNDNNEMLNRELAETFVMFLGSKITAGNNNAVVVLAENRSIAKWINNKMQDFEFRKKLYSYIDYEIAIIAIDKNKWNEIKFEYQTRSQNGTLPTFKEFDLDSFYEGLSTQLFDQSEDSEYLKRAKEIFGIANVRIVD